MAGISSNPNSPRQKMINLMYLVFIALMALNVSSEVLDGFELVENSLRTSTRNSTRRNEEVKTTLERAYQENPTKVGEWHEKGEIVKAQSDELYGYINELKLRIVQEADGKKADIENIKQKENLEAASRVMLAPIVGEGKKLRERIEQYRSSMSDIVGDAVKKDMFIIMLSTEVPPKAGIIPTSWENALFENMPVAAAITLLTKLQSDIRFVEGETLSTLLTNVDVGDYRVNQIQALVIPRSQIVTSGMPYQAQIVLAAVDSTKQPEYYLGETLLKDNNISIGTSVTGDKSFSGKVVAEGETYLFSSNYSVTESSATIAPVLMKFLYEVIDNDVEIAMAGVPSGSVTARLSGTGNIRQKERNIWTVTGLDMASSDKVSIILSGNVGGQTITASEEFTVRQLPAAQAFMSYKDANDRTQIFRSGPISKRNLVKVTGIEAAVDDGNLYIPYPVTEFTLRRTDNLGVTMPEISRSGNFTEKQKEIINNMSSGTRFLITEVKVLHPSGTIEPIQYAMDIVVTQ